MRRTRAYFPAALCALMIFGTPAAVSAQPAAGGDGAQPLSEYDHLPQGLMMMKINLDNKNDSSAQADDNGDMNQVMDMSDIRTAYASGEYAIAATHLKAIAGDSYPEAEELLGIMYRNGQGVQKNPKLALDWLTKAAVNGRGLAAHYIGIMYYTGDGLPKSPIQAAMWLYISVNNDAASSADAARAKTDLDNIITQIGRRNRANAYDLAHSWLENHNMTVNITPP